MPIASVNPATGEVLRSFDPLTSAQIDTKIEKATDAFRSFRHLAIRQRAEKMARAAEILEREKEDIARLMTTEMGKTFRSAIDEIAKCAWACRYYAEMASGFLADEVIHTGRARTFVRYQPLGVILAVMPWNFPFWQVFRFIAPTLMAGNVGLLKHASNVPQCALKIEDILLRAGFSEGVFQTLLIGSDAVAGILSDDRIAAATLTGSEGAGIEIGVAAARKIKKVVLELGGSDPFIVMPGADVDAAASWAVKARCINNGQSCIAAKRFIVHEAISEQFEQRFVKGMEALKIGDPMDPSTDLGPLANAAAVASLHEDVQKSVAAGARLLTGGRPPDVPGFFFAPTVLTDIPKGSPAYGEEMFGPVACVFPVKDIDQAIAVANDTRFGLGASVWTAEPSERERFINELDAGLVFVNKMVASDPRLPFGGVKASGHGRELGHHGIHEFTNVQTVWIEGEI
jgi:succinate-semialdehyde dehydrogenase/glutarate-semialdehyde dehydrogenase